MKKYSEDQIQMIQTGIRNGMSLDAIKVHPDFRKAGAQYAKDKADAYKTWSAADYLGGPDGYNAGPFSSKAEQERAMNLFVTDDRGRQVRLYDISAEYRTAYQVKAEQSSNEVMGYSPKPEPLTPEALLRASQLDTYHAIKEDLFDKASERNPSKVERTQARQKILALGQDPNYQALAEEFEPDQRPYESWLKQQPGGVRIQTFPLGTDAENEAECARRNAENYSARPGEDQEHIAIKP